MDVVGVKKAIKLFYATRQKEANGGVLIQVTLHFLIISIKKFSEFTNKNEPEKSGFVAFEIFL